ncbi:hypothetical protein SUGI_0404750 [Cryptomeria japonica]|nr:hypothetical protein SUGI_0404750 [Cryptomeria japonica]
MLLLLSHLNNLLSQQHNLLLLHIHHQLLNILVHTPLLLLDLTGSTTYAASGASSSAITGYRSGSRRSAFGTASRRYGSRSLVVRSAGQAADAGSRDGRYATAHATG